MAKMTPQEAKRILHPETTLEAYAETDYYGGFAGAKKWKEAVDEACLVACEALEKQTPKKPMKKNPICYEKTVDGQENYAYDCYCPTCDTNVNDEKHHCPCGQALDWSDAE